MTYIHRKNINKVISELLQFPGTVPVSTKKLSQFINIFRIGKVSK